MESFASVYRGELVRIVRAKSMWAAFDLPVGDRHEPLDQLR